MTLALALKLYAVAFATFMVIDLIWLGLIANDLYRKAIGPLMLDKPNWPVAVVFYLIFVAGLVYFAIGPAADGGTFQDALVKGALFGFFTYATFDLTNWAVLKGWTPWIVPIDMAWGTFLGGSVASITWFINDRLLS
jgi:uncharacterized membrane protein